jgi:hypothetical protein
MPSIKEKSKSAEKKKSPVVAHAPSFGPLQNGHTLMHILHFLGRVSHATGAFCTPYI